MIAMGKQDVAERGQAELRSMECDLDRCRQGISRLDCSRELLIENMEAIKRWQESFSEPLERFPGGAELIEQTESEVRKTCSEFQELYEGAKSEYLEAQKRIEADMDAKKRELSSGGSASKATGGGESDVD